MPAKRAAYLMNEGALQWLADLDPAAFYLYRGGECRVNYSAIADRAGLARTALTKYVNDDQSLTLDIFTALVTLAADDYGVDEDEALHALFTRQRLGADGALSPRALAAVA